MKLNALILCLSIICLPACTWIEPTMASKQVTLVKPFNVKECLKLGTFTVTVTTKVGILIRADEAITEDLIASAKNRAGELGADSIIAIESNVKGKMSFESYKCGE
jgi:hypothetical protein